MAKQSFAGVRYTSETSRYRDVLAEHCAGYGLDVGFGGDPVHSDAIRMDLPTPYATTGDAGVQLGGDCRDLWWFRDGVLDFVYSSHVLEDFDERETEPVLREWARVLKPGGSLVLLLPDQQRYAAYCDANGLGPNAHHSIAHFSLRYVEEVAGRLGNLESVVRHPELGPYSFAVVFRKTGASPEADEREDLRARLQRAWEERDDLKAELQRCRNRLASVERSRLFRLGERLRGLLGR